MRVFVTGVTGFLGSHVAEALLRAGHDVTALARRPGALDPDLAPWLQPFSASDRAGSRGAQPAAGARTGARAGAGPGQATGALTHIRAAPGSGQTSLQSGAHQRPNPAVTPGQDAGPVLPAGGVAGSAPPGSRTTGGSLRLLPGALSDAGALAEGTADAEAVVHVAGLIQARSESEFMRVNRDGTAAMVRAARDRAGVLCRFVLVSSQAAGGPSADGRAVTSEDTPRPVSAYGRSKRAGEVAALALTTEIPVTILRPPVIFGPRDSMLRGFFRAVSHGTMVVWRDGTNRFSVSYAPDVARAALLALETDHPSGSILYTSDERAFDWRSFVETLASIVGRRVRIFPLPGSVFAAAAALSTVASFSTGRPPLLSFDKIRELREPYWLCSSEPARRLLGWRPSIPVEQALAETHAWYKTRGLL